MEEKQKERKWIDKERISELKECKTNFTKYQFI